MTDTSILDMIRNKKPKKRSAYNNKSRLFSSSLSLAFLGYLWFLFQKRIGKSNEPLKQSDVKSEGIIVETIDSVTG